MDKARAIGVCVRPSVCPHQGRKFCRSSKIRGFGDLEEALSYQRPPADSRVSVKGNAAALSKNACTRLLRDPIADSEAEHPDHLPPFQIHSGDLAYRHRGSTWWSSADVDHLAPRIECDGDLDAVVMTFRL